MRQHLKGWTLAAAISIALVIPSCAPVLRQDAEENSRSTLLWESLLSEADRHLADSLLTLGLDREGLFTIAAPVKPMSNILTLYLPVLIDSVRSGEPDMAVLQPGHQELLSRLHRIAAVVRTNEWKLVVVPYRHVQGLSRVVEVSVVRPALLDTVLNTHGAFWGQWGFVAGSDPGVVITTVENAPRYDRWRGYGYLFGYPGDAVSFFVDAGRKQDSTKNLVARTFFQIPTWADSTGRFVYAIPRDAVPGRADSVLLRRSRSVLEAYRDIRPAFARPDGTLRALDLVRDERARGVLRNAADVMMR